MFLFSQLTGFIILRILIPHPPTPFLYILNIPPNVLSYDILNSLLQLQAEPEEPSHEGMVEVTDQVIGNAISGHLLWKGQFSVADTLEDVWGGPVCDMKTVLMRLLMLLSVIYIMNFLYFK